MPRLLPGLIYYREADLLSVKLSCPVKINLTLRVFSQRADGYHEIYSLFWRKKATEGLSIVPSNDENIGDFLKAIYNLSLQLEWM